MRSIVGYKATGVWLTTTGCLLALATEASAGHHFGPDRPTPPPCSAEGGCYPKRSEWGYYEGRWRRWPGDYDEAFPTPADGGKSVLDPVEPIAPELEDQQAPPPSKTEESENAKAADAVQVELPPIPQPGAPRQQDSEPSLPEAPETDDAPPGLPFGPPAPPGFGPPPSSFAPPAGRSSDLRNLDNDAPPVPPMGFTLRFGSKTGVDASSDLGPPGLPF